MIQGGAPQPGSLLRPALELHLAFFYLRLYLVDRSLQFFGRSLQDHPSREVGSSYSFIHTGHWVQGHGNPTSTQRNSKPGGPASRIWHLVACTFNVFNRSLQIVRYLLRPLAICDLSLFEAFGPSFYMS